jgi:hypothetical protein
MRPSLKKYNTMYKKRVLERDSYLPRRSPKGIIQCTGCGAFYYKRRWTLRAPSEFTSPFHAHAIYCPACRKMRERFPGGELHLLGIEADDRSEIARMLRNEEERARQKNPLERIMRLQAKNGDWWVETTTEKLAQRLGRCVHKARGGKLQYKMGHNNKFMRVVWEKGTESAYPSGRD